MEACIISRAQQASPKLRGQREDWRAQLVMVSREVLGGLDGVEDWGREGGTDRTCSAIFMGRGVEREVERGEGVLVEWLA